MFPAHIRPLLLLQRNHFNTIRPRGNSGTSHHTSAQKIPLGIYFAFLVHSEIPSRLLVDNLDDLG